RHTPERLARGGDDGQTWGLGARGSRPVNGRLPGSERSGAWRAARRGGANPRAARGRPGARLHAVGPEPPERDAEPVAGAARAGGVLRLGVQRRLNAGVDELLGP